MFDVRSRSWETPARPPTQLPVASAWRSRWVSRSGRIAEEMQQGPVQDRFDLLDPVLLRLPRRELLLQIVDRVVPREDPVRRVDLLVLAFLAVRVDDVRHLRRGDDRVVDLFVLLHAEGF